MENCPICKTECCKDGVPNMNAGWYHCPRCGVFQATGPFVLMFPEGLPEEQWIALSGIIRHETDLHERYDQLIHDDNYESIINSFPVPEKLFERVEIFIRAIGERLKYPGDGTHPESMLSWMARLFLPDRERFISFIREVHNRGLIKKWAEQPVKLISFDLTWHGWDYFEQTRKRKGEGNQAFVAMWFHEDMKQTFDDGYSPALRDCGFKPLRIDNKATLGRLDAEIIAEIRRSRILIADVTGERPSVYYEAGYAQGLEIPVIWCCNNSWKVYLPPAIAIKPSMDKKYDLEHVTWTDRLHFDTSQFQYIFWSNASELRKILRDRIIMLGLHLKPAHEIASTK